ncbi:MAG: alpha/beta fold hydrolase [Spirillospora sp.]
MDTVDLPHGTVSYRATGPEDATAPPVVFVHGFLVDGSLWSGVADRLAEQDIRSYAPNWPLGSHRVPVPSADQSPRGVARQILAFLEALDLTDVTLIGNDTGGALCQYAVDTDPSRIGRLVLTNCDSFDTFPPFPFNVIFKLLNGPRRLRFNLLPMRLRPFRHSALGFGLLARKFDPAQTRGWVEPALTDAAIRSDAVRFLRAVDPSELNEISTRLAAFQGPVRLIWGMRDRSFTPTLGRRLAQAFSDAEFIEIPEARTFVPLDAPQALADRIAEISNATSSPS